MEVNLGRYIHKIWRGNDTEILLCILISIKIPVGVIFRRKCLYSYSEIRSIERVLKLCMSIFQVRFVDSILSNNSTDDHCREFVRLGGLEPLITILGLPNLPLDFVSSPACQSVSGVCKSVLVSDTTVYKSQATPCSHLKAKTCTVL